MENDISSADSAILAANDLKLHQNDEIFVSLINGKSVMGREIRRADEVRYETHAKQDSKRERGKRGGSLFDDLMNHVP